MKLWLRPTRNDARLKSVAVNGEPWSDFYGDEVDLRRDMLSKGITVTARY